MIKSKFYNKLNKFIIDNNRIQKILMKVRRLIKKISMTKINILKLMVIKKIKYL
jgi:hypothetical protein